MEAIFHCNGSSITEGGGSWIGHVWPSIFISFWATHWLFGNIRKYLNSSRQEPYVSESYCTGVLMFWGGPVEPIVKVVFPFLAMTLELWLAHSDGYRRLICPEGEVRAGHFQALFLANWQHAAMYPAFIVSGLVELLSMKLPLPPGTRHVFLAGSFVVESLLMGLHTKHLPLDQVIHLLLVYAMAATAVAVLIEVIYPFSFLATFSRIGCMYLQGSWFFGVAYVMYDPAHIPPWDNASGDMAPVMSIVSLFVAYAVCVLLGMAAVFAAMTTLWSHRGWLQIDVDVGAMADVDETSPSARGTKSVAAAKSQSPKAHVQLKDYRLL
jgi:hypothetical protein